MGSAVADAVDALRRGGVIAYPTEAVWGLGCDPHDENAVRRLFEIKQRPAGVGVLLIGARCEHVARYIDAATPADAQARACSAWPGAQTWVLPASAEVPVWIRGAHPGVALRVTAHPVAAALCEAFGGAIVSTSANRHGDPPARSAAAVRASFGSGIDAIVEGALGGLERPTPIRDAISGELLRS